MATSLRKPPLQFGIGSLLGLMLVIVSALTFYRHCDSLFVFVLLMFLSAAGVLFSGIELARWAVRSFFRNPWDSV